LTKFSVFLANYDEVSKFAADAYGNFFHEHLQSWFEILDAEPSIRSIIERLLSRGDLQKLLADAEARASPEINWPGFIEWPEDREARLGVRLALFREIAAERIDAWDFSQTHVCFRRDVQDPIRPLAKELYWSFARDLRRLIVSELKQ
jgi:hypothetical protein